MITFDWPQGLTLMHIAIPLLILGIVNVTVGILAHTKKFGGDNVEQRQEKTKEE